MDLSEKVPKFDAIPKQARNKSDTDELSAFGVPHQGPVISWEGDRTLTEPLSGSDLEKLCDECFNFDNFNYLETPLSK